MEIPQLMSQMLFVVGIALTGLLIERLTRIETSLACVLAGIGAGQIQLCFD